jgi:hypothetical protein
MADVSLLGLVPSDSWSWKLSDVIAVVAIAVGVIQFVALITTVCVMMRTARTQLRAYLSVEPDGINPYKGQNYLISHIKIRNNGQIPARDVSVYSAIDRDTNGQRKAFDLGAVTAAKTAVQPRAKMRVGTGAWNIPAASDRQKELELNGWLYVWGKVTYNDSYGTQRWTKFCHRYPCEMFGKDGADFHSISVKHARYHEDGNEVD